MKSPHEMTDDELCRAVATEVLGLTYRDSASWGRQYYDPATLLGQLCPDLNWNDAGRVVQVMEKEGYHYAVRRGPDCMGQHLATFYKGAAPYWDALHFNPARAVFEAALMAKRAQR